MLFPNIFYVGCSDFFLITSNTCRVIDINSSTMRLDVLTVISLLQFLIHGVLSQKTIILSLTCCCNILMLSVHVLIITQVSSVRVFDSCHYIINKVSLMSLEKEAIPYHPSATENRYTEAASIPTSITVGREQSLVVR